MHESHKHLARSAEELILLLMAAVGAIAVMPFAIMRFGRGDWALFALDAILVVGLTSLLAYVFVTRRLQIARYAIALLCLAAVVATVYVAGVAQLFWSFPAVLIMFYLLPSRHAVAVAGITFAALLPELVTGLPPIQLMTALITLLLTIAFSFAFASQTEAQRSQLLHAVTRDPLTGAANRRALGQRLNDMLARNRRGPLHASLLMIDVDHFKSINDRFGHAAGDEVLIGVVQAMRQRVRETDTIFRIGGEEFLIIAENTQPARAHTLAEDLRVLIEAARLVDTKPVTVSIGVAQLVAEEDSDSWLKRADDALYEAKRAGRNRVVKALADGSLVTPERNAAASRRRVS